MEVITPLVAGAVPSIPKGIVIVPPANITSLFKKSTAFAARPNIEQKRDSTRICDILLVYS